MPSLGCVYTLEAKPRSRVVHVIFPCPTARPVRVLVKPNLRVQPAFTDGDLCTETSRVAVDVVDDAAERDLRIGKCLSSRKIEDGRERQLAAHADVQNTSIRLELDQIEEREVFDPS